MGQPACLEEIKAYFQNPANQSAIAGPQTRQSPRRNPPFSSKDELVKDTLGAPIDSNGTLALMPAVSCAPISAFASTPASPGGTYTDVLLQRPIKLAPDSFVQGQAHTQELTEP